MSTRAKDRDAVQRPERSYWRSTFRGHWGEGFDITPLIEYKMITDSNNGELRRRQRGRYAVTEPVK